jgi:FAD/FMN-containing dehydrogenase
MIVSLDMKMMNAIKWVDRESMMACIEAGAVGKELEARLGMMGYGGRAFDSV